MQTKQKWLIAGGGLAVVAIIGLAIGLNQGNLFTGQLKINPNLANIITTTASEYQSSGQNASLLLLKTSGGRDGRDYQIFIDQRTINGNAVTVDSSDTTNPVMVIDGEKLARLGSDFDNLYLKLSPAVQNDQVYERTDASPITVEYKDLTNNDVEYRPTINAPLKTFQNDQVYERTDASPIAVESREFSNSGVTTSAITTNNTANYSEGSVETRGIAAPQSALPIAHAAAENTQMIQPSSDSRLTPIKTQLLNIGDNEGIFKLSALSTLANGDYQVGIFTENGKLLTEFPLKVVESIYGCISADHMAFTPAKLTFDADGKTDTSSTNLSAFDGKSAVSIPDKKDFCPKTYDAIKLDPDAVGLSVTIKDGSVEIATENINFEDQEDGESSFSIFNGGITASDSTENDIKVFKFNNVYDNLVSSEGQALDLGKTYTVEVTGLVQGNDDSVGPSKLGVLAKYDLELEAPVSEPPLPECISADHMAFTPDKLTFDADGKPDPQSTVLSVYDDKNNVITLAKDQSLCSETDLDKLLLNEENKNGLSVEIKGEDDFSVHTDEDIVDFKDLEKTTKKFLMFENSVEIAGTNASGLPVLDFNNQYKELLDLGLIPGKTYTVEVSGMSRGGSGVPQTIKNLGVLAKYELKLLAPEEEPPKEEACIPADHMAFNPAELTFDADGKPDPQSTVLSVYDKEGKPVNLPKDQSLCAGDITKLLDPATVGLNISIKDGADNKMITEGNLDLDQVADQKVASILTDSLKISAKSDLGLPVLNFVNHYQGLSKSGLSPGKTYRVEVSSLVKDDGGKPIPSDLGVLTSYKLVMKAKPADKPADKPVDKVIPTKPSIEPCVVDGKNFYLADGPDSAYCKDLQSLGSTFKADQSPETPQVRYTTALAAQRIIADIIAKKKLDAGFRFRNLPTDWYKVLTDAEEIKDASTQEKSDFKNVYSSNVLRGRKDPQSGQVTLDPLDRIKYVEILSLLQQTLSAVTGYQPAKIDSQIPSYAVEFKYNKDTVWMYEAISFGVEFKIISKNEFSADMLQDYASRADLAKLLSRFQGAIEADPSLLES